MFDRDDLHATVALLGEMDGDLEFFDGLFGDFPPTDQLCGDTGGIIVSPVSTPTISTVLCHPTPSGRTFPASSDRRRQRWAALDGDKSLMEAPHGWKDVAKSQKHAREAAESENARLRRLVASHERAVTKMVKLMQKAAALSSNEIVAQPVVALGIPYRGPPADLRRISHALDALVHGAELALPLALAGSPALQICGLENRIVSCATGDALESTVVMSWILPFDVDAITSAMLAHSLRLVTRKHVPNCTTIHESAGFKVVQAVTKAKEKNGVRITKHGQLATRREPLRDDGSQLVVIDLQGALFLDATRVVSIEGDSSIDVRPVSGHDSAALGPLSRITWHRRFRAQPVASVTMTPADRARWINMFSVNSTRKTERHVDKITQAIENLLLSPR